MRLFLSLLLLTAASLATTAPAQVLPGIDVLERDGFAPLQGKRVGLITNPTGISRDGRSTVEILHRAKGVTLAALYGPEHGVYGDQIAGGYVATTTDKRTGLPAFSLYGPTRKPTAAMLKGIDVLVFDIQDIGVRSYTYVSTLGLAMEAAGEAGIEFMVLDRPNPLGGHRVEGPGLQPKFRSFVSQWPLAYVYGLTSGEAARMIAGEKWIARAPKLTVIPAAGWKRSMSWADTGLTWVPTSPHIPTPDTALLYAATGWIGELGTVSNGVGYPQPFALVGLPGIPAEEFARRMNARNLPGLRFRPAYYKSFYTAFKDKVCGGVQIHLVDPSTAHLAGSGIHLFEELSRLAKRNLFAEAKPENIRMFDQVAGSDTLRQQLLAGTPAARIVASWKDFEDRFRQQREPYLLYR